PARPATAPRPAAASPARPTVPGDLPGTVELRPGAASPRAVVSPRVQPALEQRQLWERRYRRRLQLSDFGVVVGTTALTAWLQTTAALPVLLVREPMLNVRVAVLTAT